MKKDAYEGAKAFVKAFTRLRPRVGVNFPMCGAGMRGWVVVVCHPWNDGTINRATEY